MICAICLELLGSDIHILKNCKHTFHTKCIVNWWEVSDTCPCCRKSLRPQEYDVYEKCDQLRGIMCKDNEEYNKFVLEINKLCDNRDILIDEYYDIVRPLKEKVFERYGVFDDITDEQQMEFKELHSDKFRQMAMIRVKLDEIDTKLIKRREILATMPYVVLQIK